MHRFSSPTFRMALSCGVLSQALFHAPWVLAQPVHVPVAPFGTQKTDYDPIEVTAPALPYRQFEKVEITGSSILAKEAKQALPIQIITRREIERSGAADLTQLLQRVPVMNNFQEQGTVTGTTSGGPQSAAVHGNQNGTLVLLNGRRLPYYGNQTIAGERAVVDLNFIPLSAVEKIEILTDGASSRYGSDAVAGVVNVITRSQLQGTTISVETFFPQGGAGRANGFNLSWGQGRLERDGYSMRAYFSATQQDMLQAKAHPSTQEGRVPFVIDGETWFKGANYSNYSAPARNYKNAAGKIRNEYLDAYGVCEPGWYLLAAGYCAINTQPEMTLYPATDRQQIFLQAEKLLDNQWGLFSELQTVQHAQFFQPLGHPYWTIEQPGTDPSRTYLISAQPWGLFQQRYENTMHHAVLGLRGEVEGWDFTGHLTQGQHKVKRAYVGGFVYRGYDTVRLKPEEVGLSPSQYSAETMAQFEAYRRTSDVNLDDGKTVMQTWGVLASRPAWETDHGAVMIGVGVDGRRESVQYLSAQTTRPSFEGQRDNWAVHSEIQLPVAEALETTAALRRDQYSDFGGVQTGKLGWKWRPETAWMVRGSLGTGFRAPAVAQMAPVSTQFTDAYDDVSGKIYPVDFSGNPRLKPERSRQWMLGARWDPSPRWTVGADVWGLFIRDTFGNLSGQTILADPVLRAQYLANGRVSSPNLNLGVSDSRGVDYDLQWRQPTEVGRWRLALRGTYMLKSQRQMSEYGAMESNLGRYADATGSVMPRHQMAWSLFLEQAMSVWGATLNFRSGNTEQTRLINIQGQAINYLHEVPADWSLDLSSRWSVANSLTWAVNLLNATNRMPPFRMRTGNVLNGVDTRYGNYYGRALYLKAEYKF